MFKLYLNKGTRTQIDESEDERDFIGTMGDFIEKDPESRFMIKTESEEYGDSVKSVNGLLEYIVYAKSFDIDIQQKPKQKRLKK